MSGPTWSIWQTPVAQPIAVALHRCVECGRLATDVAARQLGWTRIRRRPHQDRTVCAQCHQCQGPPRGHAEYVVHRRRRVVRTEPKDIAATGRCTSSYVPSVAA